MLSPAEIVFLWLCDDPESLSRDDLELALEILGFDLDEVGRDLDAFHQINDGGDEFVGEQ